MFINTRQFLMGLMLSLMLLPLVAFASTEFKGTETVNINKANAATLAAYLKGVGPSKAEAIVKYRRSNGSFKSAADIVNVPGVGDETYKDIKSKISTSRGKSTAPKGYKLGKTNSKSTATKKKKTTATKSKAKKTSTTAKAVKKSSNSKSTTSKTKKKSTAKKTSTTKKKPSTSTKAKTKKKTVRCKSGQKKVKGKCVSA